MKEPQVLVTERTNLKLGSDSLRSKTSSQSISYDQLVSILTDYLLKSDYNIDKTIINQQIEDILFQLDHIPSMNVDDFLSLDSENPVQNKVLTAALNNKPDRDTTYTAGTNVIIDANNVISAVDTKYTAGDNITINNNVISATDTTYTASDFDIKDLSDSTNLKRIWSGKQDQLTAGTNITIENNVISATGGSSNGLKQVDLTTYTDGIEGEIVQHIGSTTEDYIHGYIYKLSPGHVVRYEDVTIPSGSKVIVYTNKFDQSVKRVYEVESINIPYTIYIGQYPSGDLYELDNELKSEIDQSNGYWKIPSSYQSILPDDSNTMYTNRSTIDIVYKSLTDNQLRNMDQLHNYINGGKFKSRYLSQLNTESIELQLIDLVCLVTIPAINTVTGDAVTNASYNSFYMRLSEFARYNYDIRNYLTEVKNFPIRKSSSFIVDYDPSKADTTICYLRYMIYSDRNGNEFIYYPKEFSSWNTSGDTLYRVISQDESDSYIFRYKLEYKLKSISNIYDDTYFNDSLDQELYFDYTAQESTTSDTVIVHRKIVEYDEYGQPIEESSSTWQRINVQPAIQNDDLWTSIND